MTVPPYIGISLCAEGTAIRKPNGFVRRSIDTNNADPYFTPRKVIFHENKENINTINKSSNNGAPTLSLTKRPQSEMIENSGQKNGNATTNSAPAKGKSAPGDSRDYHKTYSKVTKHAESQITCK